MFEEQINLKYETDKFNEATKPKDPNEKEKKY